MPRAGRPGPPRSRAARRPSARRARLRAPRARRAPRSGAVAREQDLPIARYASLNADEILARLPELSQVELGKVDVYERRHDNRSTVTDRISTLRTSEPWAGYDELTVDELRSALAQADESRARKAREYERAHKNRAGVIEATERELANA